MQSRQVTYWFELSFWSLMVRLLSKARLMATTPRLASLAREIEGLRQVQSSRSSFPRDLLTAMAGWLCGLLAGILFSSWIL
jgi:hypothetical protein